MDIETLIKFLNEANKATYANKDALKVVPSHTQMKNLYGEQIILVLSLMKNQK